MPGSTTESEAATFSDISVSAQDIENCIYSHWYEKFSQYTYTKATILKPVPKEFISYLEADDIVLPKDEDSKPMALFQDVVPNEDNDYSDWEEEDEAAEGKGGDKKDQNTKKTACDEHKADGKTKKTAKSGKKDPLSEFPEFHSKIKAAIHNLGSVAPKLNWSCPQDATWMMMNNTMQCKSAAELYLLLKSSDYVNHDLGHAFECVTEGSGKEGQDNIEYELVLRKWAEMNPAMEFRCFVRDRRLVAITQRDLNYYTFLAGMKREILTAICKFFDRVLLPRFDSHSFAFDVYISKTLDKVYLVDIDPFARKTDSLLFTWNELATINEENPVFRLVEKENSGQFASKAHSQNQVPKEVVDATIDANALVELARKWEQLMRKEEDDE